MWRFKKKAITWLLDCQKVHDIHESIVQNWDPEAYNSKNINQFTRAETIDFISAT